VDSPLSFHLDPAAMSLEQLVALLLVANMGYLPPRWAIVEAARRLEATGAKAADPGPTSAARAPYETERGDNGGPGPTPPAATPSPENETKEERRRRQTREAVARHRLKEAAKAGKHVSEVNTTGKPDVLTPTITGKQPASVCVLDSSSGETEENTHTFPARAGEACKHVSAVSITGKQDALTPTLTGFDAFWAAWVPSVPAEKRVGLTEARKAWVTMEYADRPEVPLRQLAAWKRTDEWKRRVVPSAANFLTKERYTAPLDGVAATKPARQFPSIAALPEHLRQAALEEAEASYRRGGHIDSDVIDGFRKAKRNWVGVDKLDRATGWLLSTATVQTWLAASRAGAPNEPSSAPAA
jgi:hypothetical protein